MADLYDLGERPPLGIVRSDCHSGWWEPDDPWVLSGKDPMLSEGARIWG